MPVARLFNAQLAAASQARDARAEQLKAEILRLEYEAKHLVRFLAQGAELTRGRGGVPGLAKSQPARLRCLPDSD